MPARHVDFCNPPQDIPELSFSGIRCNGSGLCVFFCMCLIGHASDTRRYFHRHRWPNGARHQSHAIPARASVSADSTQTRAVSLGPFSGAVMPRRWRWIRSGFMNEWIGGAAPAPATGGSTSTSHRGQLSIQILRDATGTRGVLRRLPGPLLGRRRGRGKV